MKAADIQIGKVYAVKVSGKIQPVKIIRKIDDGFNHRTGRSVPGGWAGRNEQTGREVYVRSAQRCRHEIGGPVYQDK